jgi:predicted  nucleic acid-binding Zn-ribbon protein
MRTALLLATGAYALRQTPVARVVELIKGLKTEIETDGKTEQTAYDKFACWCEETLAKKAAAIDQAKDDIAQLSKKIVSLKGSTATLKADIAQVIKDIAANKQSQAEATDMRQNEHNTYNGAREDAEKATSALKGATDVLAGATGRGLLQQVQTLSVVAGVRSALKLLPKDSLADDDMSTINNFVNDPEGFMGKKSAAFLETSHNPHGDYAPASTAIQGILKNMYDTFVDNIQSMNTEEATKQKNFEELIATKQRELAALVQTQTDKEQLLGQQKKEMADAFTQRTETEAQLKADQEFFADTKNSCAVKADEWAERTRLRTEELAGIEQAIGILEDGSLTFEESGSTLLQLSSFSRNVKLEKATRAVQDLARSTHSLRLASLAVAVKTGGHFDDIISKIDNMIRTLRDEETEDLAHKDRCEAEETLLGSRNDTIKDKKENAQAAIDKLNGEIDAAETTKTNKQAEKKQTEDDLAEALNMRNDENAAYKKARAADQQAMELITQAVGSMMKFYEKNKLALVADSKRVHQEPEPKPDTWAKPYGGRKSENTGVVAILEMIKEDVANEMKQAQKDEKQAVEEYWTARKALEKSKNQLEQNIVTLNKNIASMENRVSQLEAVVTNLGQQKDANASAKDAFDTDCGWVKTNFDKRRDARQHEMEGLQQAKSFLAGGIHELDVEDPSTIA